MLCLSMWNVKQHFSQQKHIIVTRANEVNNIIRFMDYYFFKVNLGNADKRMLQIALFSFYSWMHAVKIDVSLIFESKEIRSNS